MGTVQEQRIKVGCQDMRRTDGNGVKESNLSCQQCRQPLEEWEAGICEGCGIMRNVLTDLLAETTQRQRYILNPERTLPYQYAAPNAAIAERVADYLVFKLGHDDVEVAISGLRVLHKTPVEGLNSERLGGYIDGLNDACYGDA